MTSDRDLERRLEDYLARSARPMPPELLAEVVRDVTRSGAGTRATFGSGARWQLGLAVIAAGAVFAVAVFANLAGIAGPGSDGSARPTATPSPAASPSASGDSTAALHWNPWAYFLLGAQHLNPAPDAYGNREVWGYGHGSAEDPLAFAELMDAFVNDRWAFLPFPGLEIWRTGGGIALHPWAANGVARSAILRWTSPFDGPVRVTGFFRGLERPCALPDDGVVVSVVHEAAVLWTRPLAAGPESFRIDADVARGSQLLFVVQAGADSNCDATELVLDIVPR